MPNKRIVSANLRQKQKPEDFKMKRTAKRRMPRTKSGKPSVLKNSKVKRIKSFNISCKLKPRQSACKRRKIQQRKTIWLVKRSSY